MTVSEAVYVGGAIIASVVFYLPLFDFGYEKRKNRERATAEGHSALNVIRRIRTTIQDYVAEIPGSELYKASMGLEFTHDLSAIDRADLAIAEGMRSGDRSAIERERQEIEVLYRKWSERRRVRDAGIRARTRLDHIRTAIQDFDVERETNTTIESVLVLSAIDRAARAIAKAEFLFTIEEESQEIEMLYRKWFERRRVRIVGTRVLAELDDIRTVIQDYDAETNAPIGHVELAAIDRAARHVAEDMLAGEHNVIDDIVREYHEIQVLYRNWHSRYSIGTGALR